MPKVVTKVAYPPQLQRKKRVAAYARVSSGKDAMLHSLSAQVSYYNDLIQKEDGWEFVGVYSDEAVTGTKEDRAGFQQMLEDCRNGKIDMVLTKSISRFARNTVTLLETVRMLKALGVDVFFEEQNIHTVSADGELMLTILASYAQEEGLATLPLRLVNSAAYRFSISSQVIVWAFLTQRLLSFRFMPTGCLKSARLIWPLL